jgi:hypothetical protein
MLRRWLVLLGAVVLAITSWLPSVSAQPARRCFPETGHCIEGRFLVYWLQNGGLDVFGYPTTGARMELNRDTGRTYLTQWFERNRFELHPANRPPYDVLLGRLGDDRLQQLGIDWQALPKAEGAQADCLWFAETGHNVCDQAPGLGFKTYWSTHGLNDPALTAYGRSLALFGLPLSEPRQETNPSGDTVLTQWFERARFEWHPDKPDQYKVLLGLLGNEVILGLRGAVVRRAAGPTPEAIRAAVDAFRADLGEPNNAAGAPASAGRREINWDAVPDNLAAPNNLPADFFNVTSKRGAVFATPGGGFQVSANEGVAPVRFGTINPSYAATFSAFSPQRLFTALGSPVTEVSFFVPGTSTPAVVSGFGAVFTDVDRPGATRIEYYDRQGRLLGVFWAPVSPNGGLSFLGVSARDDAPRIARVRIVSGNTALSPTANDGGGVDVVVMDDFLYGEPQPAS